mmetsp:Transcript_33874/g.108272  ORF Transcript_33874/g.108272 Transcript_33874/m.108272 type:complete len:156 (+) Transcript_33874:3728-4195(+)
MLSINILRAAAKHGKSESALDEGVPENRGCDSLDNFVDYAQPSPARQNPLLVTLRDSFCIACCQVTLRNVISFENCCDNGQCGVACCFHIIAVSKDSSYINFFSRTGYVNQVIEEDYFFGSRNMPWWDSAWKLLKSNALIVPKVGLFVMQMEWSI